jgi:hypothetical protein
VIIMGVFSTIFGLTVPFSGILHSADLQTVYNL